MLTLPINVPNLTVVYTDNDSVLSVPKMTTTQRDELNSAIVQDGNIILNLDANDGLPVFQFRQNDEWISLSQALGTGTVTSIGTTNSGGLVTDQQSGDPITVSGNIGLIPQTNVAGTYPISGAVNPGDLTSLTIDGNGIITSSTTQTEQLGGFIQGPADTVINNIVTWDSTNGSLVQDSGVSIDNTGNIFTQGSIDVGTSTNGLQINKFGYLTLRGLISTDIGFIQNYSLNCASNVVAPIFNAYSSINIKNILGEGDSVEKEAVEIFSKIPFKKYEYKDKLNHGDKIVYGMIAEELKEVMPHSVTNYQTFTPNIMQHVVHYETYNKEHSFLLKCVLANLLDPKIKISDRIRVVDEDGEKEGVIEIVEHHNNIISISLSSYPKGKLFIYGTYSDCPAISKDDVFEMGMVVLQNLIKQLQDKSII